MTDEEVIALVRANPNVDQSFIELLQQRQQKKRQEQQEEETSSENNNNNNENKTKTTIYPNPNSMLPPPKSDACYETIKQKLNGIDSKEQQLMLLNLAKQSLKNMEIIIAHDDLESILYDNYKNSFEITNTLIAIGEVHERAVPEIIKTINNFFLAKEIPAATMHIALDKISAAHKTSKDVQKICAQYQPEEPHPFSQVRPIKGSQGSQ